MDINFRFYGAGNVKQYKGEAEEKRKSEIELGKIQYSLAFAT